MELVEFLLARIAEDEELAGEATPGPWWNESGTVHAPLPFGRNDGKPGAACHPLDAQGGNGRSPWADAEHASRWDPARVLAECAAKRRIVELHGRSHECSTYDHNGEVDNCTWVLSAEECSTLRLLALPYANHDDYRPEWAL